MKQITFLENTWIRTSIKDESLREENFFNDVLGYIEIGKIIEVNPIPETSTTSITELVNNTSVTSNEWYADKNRWYYWQGGTIGVEELKIEEDEGEKQVEAASIDWTNLTYVGNEDKMNWGIESFGIDRKFWSNGKIGQGVRVAVLDYGINLSDLKHANLRLHNCLEGIEEMIDPFGHGTKVAAIISGQIPNIYYGVAAHCITHIFKVNARNVFNNTVVRAIIKAIDKCIVDKIPIISMSMAFDPQDADVQPLISELSIKISDYVKRGGLFICAAGNKNRFDDHVKDSNGVELIPASFPDTISISSYGFKNGHVIRDEGFDNEKVNFRIPGTGLLVLKGEEFNNSSAATILFTSLVALLRSKYSIVPWSKFIDIITKPSESPIKYFDLKKIEGELSKLNGE